MLLLPGGIYLESNLCHGTTDSMVSTLKLDELPKEMFWEVLDVYRIDGFWFRPQLIDPIMAIRSRFEASKDDVISASSMKTGTTWLKALCHCIMRHHPEGEEVEDPLVRNNPHACVQNLEGMLYKDDLQPDLSGMPSPRLFNTHLPYSFLPDSIKNSECKIVYITRNPKDTLVSLWHFFNKILRPDQPPYPLEKAVESFCKGVHGYGPFHDHVLQYWEESIKMPHKVLFLRYEELKSDPRGQVKRLASFLGRPLNSEGEIDDVIWRCSLDRLKDLEVNKDGERVWKEVPNSAFFRLGVVGDWKNHLAPEMCERLDQLTRMKFEGTALDL